MTEGTLARWLKKEGDAVKSGDVLAEIETDKATMEVEAVDEGVLGKILVPDGTEGVKVNDRSPCWSSRGRGGAARRRRAGARAAQAGAPAPAPAAAPKPQPCRAEAGARAAAADGATGTTRGERIFASPLARRMAEAGRHRPCHPQGLRPEWPDRARPTSRRPQAGARAAPAAGGGTGRRARGTRRRRRPITAPHTLVPHSHRCARSSPRRLAEAKQTVPHFYVTMDIEIDALLKLRAELNAKSPKEGPGAFKLSVNDLVIKAAALTLRRVPKVNASYTEEAIILYDDVDISRRRRRFRTG